jgi:enoyl-CoA hydratase/carnithine racemase
VSAVVVERERGVCRVRLNRPEKLNALNEDVRVLLTDAFKTLADDTETRVVLVEGEGRSFSAGADLAAGGDGVDRTWAERRHAAGGWQRLLDLIESVPQVTVARLHGHCIGGAALIAISCDLRIASDDLTVRIPELHIGIPLTWSGIPRLVREVGLPVARDMVMTARKLNADDAHACGFVQRLVPRADLDSAADELVEQLLAMPTAPLAITRAMFSAIAREQLGSAGWADADLLAWSLREPEGRQAAAEYFEEQLNRKEGSS